MAILWGSGRDVEESAVEGQQRRSARSLSTKGTVKVSIPIRSSTATAGKKYITDQGLLVFVLHGLRDFAHGEDRGGQAAEK